MGVNPDQRMHEDARKLCELSADLGTGLLQAVDPVRHLRRRAVGTVAGLRDSGSATPTIAVPGFMVWAAIIYAGARLAVELLGRAAA